MLSQVHACYYDVYINKLNHFFLENADLFFSRDSIS